MTVGNPVVFGAGTTLSGGSSIVSFGLTTTVAGTNVLPFSFGHAFKKGDVPSGTQLILSGASGSVTPLKHWNDGSLKHAHVAGVATLTNGVQSNVSFVVGTPSAGANMTYADIQTAAPVANVSVTGAVSFSVDLSTLLASPPQRTWVSNPNYVECIYMTRPVNSWDVIFWVKLFANGRMHIRAKIEYGVATGTMQRSASEPPTVISPAVTIGGVTQMSLTNFTMWRNQSIKAEAWIGTDPAVFVVRDLVYLNRTLLVPNSWETTVSEAGFTDNPGGGTVGLKTAYVPGLILNQVPDTSDSGYHDTHSIFHRWDATYAITGDQRAYNSVLANSAACQVYPICWRDTSTKRIMRVTDWPTWTALGSGQGGFYPMYCGTGMTTGNGGVQGGKQIGIDTLHTPSTGYFAYLLTADSFYLEMHEQICASSFMIKSSAYGSGVNRIFNNAPREAAWNWRNWAQLSAIAPDGDVVAADYAELLWTQIQYAKQYGPDAVGPTALGYPWATGTYEDNSGGSGVFWPVTGNVGNGTMGTAFVDYAYLQTNNVAAPNTVTFTAVNGTFYTDTPTFSGTGNGTCTAMSVQGSVVEEVWTLTATSATTFSVVGSVSGVQTGASVGVAYTNSYIGFLLTAGTTAFVAGAKFTFRSTQLMFNCNSSVLGNLGNVKVGVQYTTTSRAVPFFTSTRINRGTIPFALGDSFRFIIYYTAYAPWQYHYWMASNGFSTDMEPLPDVRMTTYRSLRDWMYQGVVGILGDGSTGSYCFGRILKYFVVIGTKYSSSTQFRGAVDMISDWGTVDAATNPDLVGTCSATAIDETLGQLYANSYAMTATAAIAYAVDHGAVGSVAAWTRLVYASNFKKNRTVSGYGILPLDANPTLSWMPRSQPLPPKV
jgi:hypothetical protein